MKKINYKKLLLIGIGLILIGISLGNITHNIFFNINKQSITSLYLNQVSLNYIFLQVILLLIGFLIFKIGLNINNIFKILTKTFVFLSITFLFISFFLISLRLSSDQLINSIQPSVDYLVVSNLETIFNNTIKTNKGEIKYSYYANKKIILFYNKNLTIEKANKLLNLIGLKQKNLKDIEKIKITKEFISLIYEKLTETNEKIEEIPISLIKKFLNKYDINDDRLIFYLLNYNINKNAYLKIIEGDLVKKTININNPNKDDINRIWTSLELPENVSYETKKEYIILMFNYIDDLITSKNINISAIPLSLISSSIPNDIKKLSSFDLFNNDKNIRIKEFNRLREYCLLNQKNNKEINYLCDKLEMTKYDKLIKSLENSTSDKEMKNILKNYDSIQKLRDKINNYTKKYTLFIILWITMLILAFISYYFNFKTKKLNISLTHIFYYITKSNFYNTLFNFLIVLLIYVLLNKSVLEIMFNKFYLNKEILSLFLNLPIYNSIIKFSSYLFNISLIYFLFSIFLLIILSLLFKVEIKKEDEFMKIK